MSTQTAVDSLLQSILTLHSSTASAEERSSAEALIIAVYEAPDIVAVALSIINW